MVMTKPVLDSPARKSAPSNPNVSAEKVKSASKSLSNVKSSSKAGESTNYAKMVQELTAQTSELKVTIDQVEKEREVI